MAIKIPLQTQDVARLLDCSPRRVQQLEGAGVLIAVRTRGGQRLFDPDQVEIVRQEREANKVKRQRLA